MFFIYLINLFSKALQHKYWRSVGHQVLQPAKDVELGQYVWKVAGTHKNNIHGLSFFLSGASEFTNIIIVTKKVNKQV